MSDMGDMYREWSEHKKKLRRMYGKPCEECVSKRPKAWPSILLPQQRCKIHKSYKDARPRLTEEQELAKEEIIKDKSVSE